MIINKTKKYKYNIYTSRIQQFPQCTLQRVETPESEDLKKFEVPDKRVGCATHPIINEYPIKVAI